MVVGQVVSDVSNRKIVELTMNAAEKYMLNTSTSTDLHNLSSKDATQIMNLLASLCQIGILLRNAVDTDAELETFALNADKIIKNLDKVQCLDTDKDATGALRNRQVSGLKGIRNLLTTLKRLGLIDAFELCALTSDKREQPNQQSKHTAEQKGGMDNGKISKKPSRSKGSKKSKGSKGSKGSKKQITTAKPKRASKKQ